jgi:tryptophan synthase alpha chain
MTRIEKTFAQLKAQKKNAFVSFITAGDPDYQTSLEILKNLPKNGVDIIELGIPFLDPAGDGPIIEVASKRAIENGMNLKKVLQMASEFRSSNSETPLILMGYYNPVLKFGLEKLVKEVKSSGADGLLIVDLPPEEDEELRKYCEKNDIALIKLITPTSDQKRMKKIADNASGFLYLVSILGITGTKSANIAENKIHLEKIRKISDLPIVIGFGIKEPIHAKEMGQIGADAVVVGSSLVKIIADGIKNKSDKSKIIADVLTKAAEFSKAVKDTL